MSVFRFPLVALCCVLAFCELLSARCVSATTITITSPTSSITVKEGDDFATLNLHSSWNMKERRDIGWEEGFVESSIQTAGSGVWTGTFANSGGYVFPLFPGFKGALPAEGLPGDKKLPRLGINHHIDTSKYRLLSYKLRTSNRTSMALYWSYDPNAPQYWPDGTNYGAIYDGFYNGSNAHPFNGYNIYQFDMSNLASSFEVHACAWAGNVYALRIDPSIVGPAGTTTEFDWIRLVDPSSAPNYTITWDSTGIVSGDVIVLYADTNSTGYNGTPIARFSNNSNPGTYTFPTAMFPPGKYYFYFKVLANVTLAEKARSAYTRRLTINQAPTINFSSPTQVTGNDYATDALSNPWDLSDASDIDNLNRSKWPDINRQFSYESFNSGIFSAVADPPLYSIGNRETDAQIHLAIGPDGIDTSRYRYLTYRMMIDPTNYTTISDRVEHGWVTRVAFWNNSVLADSGLPSAHVVYEGWNTYTIDLWNNSILEGGYPWKSFPRLQHLRIDPLETTTPTRFYFDWVRLSTENKTEDGGFDIAYTIGDKDNKKLDVSIYRDTNKKNYDGKLLATFTNISRGEHTYHWNTHGLSAGKRYFIYIRVTDGLSVRKYYAPVGIVIAN